MSHFFPKQKITVKASGDRGNMKKFSIKGNYDPGFLAMLAYNILYNLRLYDTPSSVPASLRQSIRNFMSEWEDFGIKGLTEEQVEYAMKTRKIMKGHMKW